MNAPSKRPEKPKASAQSGQHPAVRAYRAKVESIAEGTSAAVSALDEKLKDFLTDLKTPIPAPTDDAPEKIPRLPPFKR